MSADIIAALVAHLKADAGVAALAGTRVVGIELPQSQVPDMPRKCVVLQPSGGVSPIGGYARHTGQRIDAVSWGETPFEAETLRRAVFAAFKPLQRATINGVLVHWVADGGGAVSRRDPDTGWPAAVQSFQAFYAEEEVES